MSNLLQKDAYLLDSPIHHQNTDDMIIEIDDAWAESELEKQLRSLTPIDDLEEAENKLSLLKSYIREDDSNFGRHKRL